MSEVGVPEAAQMLGITRARIHQLIKGRGIDARFVAGRWLIDPTSLPMSSNRGRPMSPRIAWALIELAAGKRPDWLHSDEGSRLRARYRRLADDAEPEVLVRSWLAARAERHVLAGTELDTLRGDSRLVLAGVSDPRSGMSAQSTVEAYVHQDAFDGLCADHLLVPAPRRQGNVILHVAPVLPSDPPPLLLLVADLAEHDSPRELDRARELLKTAQENL